MHYTTFLFYCERTELCVFYIVDMAIVLFSIGYVSVNGIEYIVLFNFHSIRCWGDLSRIRLCNYNEVTWLNFFEAKKKLQNEQISKHFYFRSQIKIFFSLISLFRFRCASKSIFNLFSIQYEKRLIRCPRHRVCMQPNI